MSNNIKIERDLEYSYFIASTHNQSILDTYVDLECFLIERFSEKYNFGFFLCDLWIEDSPLVHYFKLSKKKEYLSLFYPEQIKTNEGFIRKPNEDKLIRYYSSFLLESAQLNLALKLNATSTTGHSFVFLIPKSNFISESFINDILKLCYLNRSNLNWLELEATLLKREIYPIQKWDGDFEISLRIHNQY